MRYEVPQFIEVEDKIFWHLTLKQFIYVAGGSGLCIIFYLFLPFYIAIFFILPVVAFAGSLAFYKYNERPFIILVEYATKYLLNTKLYIWRKHEEPVQMSKIEEKENGLTDFSILPKLGNSKLKELTWSLDAKEATNPITRGGKTE